MLVTLEIDSHPELSDTPKKVVALDYGMQGGKASIAVRKALPYCTLKRLCLNIDTAAKEPATQQAVLLNREVVDDPSQ